MVKVDRDGQLWDIIADIGFIAYDVYDIAKTAIQGEKVTATQWQALGGDVIGAAVPGLTGVGAGIRATTKVANKVDNAIDAKRVVIGKLSDLKKPGAIKINEQTLLDQLPNKGSPKTNWKQNSGVLRKEMRSGQPIRDASVDPITGERINNTGFLRAERNLLEQKGWKYDPITNLWTPPTK